MKKLNLVFIPLLFSAALFAQDMSEVFQSKSATWFGFDYSEALFIGSEGFTNPKEIKDRYFNSWNLLVQAEYSKYDVGKAFKKENVDISLDIVTARNLEVPIFERVIDDQGKVLHLDKEKVQEIIGSYQFDDNQQGLGIVMIVESYSKTSITGYYFVTLFDIKTKQVLITERMSGKAGGFGIRNFWAKSYYYVLKEMPRKLKTWQKKYAK